MAYQFSEKESIQLLKITKTLVGHSVQKGFVTENDREDYIQDLLLRAIMMQEKIEIPSPKSFGRFMFLVLGRELIDLWRSRNPQYSVENETISLSTPIVESDGEQTELIDFVRSNHSLEDNDQSVEQHDLISDVQNFLAGLPADERRICIALMSGGQRTAARIESLSRSTIRRKIDGNRAASRSGCSGWKPEASTCRNPPTAGLN